MNQMNKLTSLRDDEQIESPENRTVPMINDKSAGLLINYRPALKNV